MARGMALRSPIKLRSKIVDYRERPVDSFARENELKKTLDRILGDLNLTSRHRTVIKLRFGLDDGYDYERWEIGLILKCSPEKVRMMEDLALHRLSQPKRAKALFAFIESPADIDLDWLPYSS